MVTLDCNHGNSCSIYLCAIETIGYYTYNHAACS